MGRWMQTGRTALVLLLAIGVTAACRKEKDDDDDGRDDEVAFVADGSDTAVAETDVQLITSSLVSASPGSVGLASSDLTGNDLQPREFGDGAKAIYFPRGCLEVVPDAATQTATYTFDHCMGPSGLRNVTGVVKAKYERVAPGQLHLELTGSDLTVNRATIDWAAAADITADGASRSMTWKAQLSGTSARGRSFSRTNAHTIAWTVGESCFAFEGTSEGDVAGRQLRSEVVDFRRCRRACPDAGGKIIFTNVTKDLRYELRYDGTDRATFIGPNGRVVAIPLNCGP